MNIVLGWYWLPPLIWMGFLFFVSAQPDPPGPTQPLLNKLYTTIGHLVAYGFLANGTFVNGRRIKAHWLANGDLVTIGKHTLAFSDPSGRRPAETGPASIIETMQMDPEMLRNLQRRGPAGEVAAADVRPTLAVLSGHRRELPLGEKSVHIGRSKTSDIMADGLFVGETAAVINKLADGWYVSRVGGLARVRVNDQVVREAVRLKRLDVIAVGKLRLQFLMRG